MSGKILVLCVGLVCVLASPALAAPGLVVTNIGLNASGDWQWRVSVDPDDALFWNPPTDNPDQGMGGSVAAELGFTASVSNLVSATPNTTNFPLNENPGTAIPGFPVGDGVTVAGNNVAAYLGSTFFTTGTPKEMLIITTAGPATEPANGSLTTTISWLGAYGGNGRIAQRGDVPPGNYDTFAGMASRTARRGDTTLDGVNNSFDVTPFLLGFQAGTGNWSNGDFTGDGLVNSFDTTQLLLGLSDPPAGAGSALGAGSAVPEPASLALLIMGAVASVLYGRRCRAHN